MFILLTALFISSSFAQTGLPQPQTSADYLRINEIKITALEAEIKLNEEDITHFQSSLSRRNEYHRELKEEIAKHLAEEKWDLFGNATRKYLKCFQKELEKGIHSVQCQRKNEPDLSKDIAKKIEFYQKYVVFSPEEIEKKIEESKDKAEELDKQLKDHQRAVKELRNRIEREEEKAIGDKNVERLVQVYKKNPENYKCDPGTPTIDLEETGVFKDLPRDHQNGMGTCFANTGKNLLFAITGGEVNASFLDMALQYMGDNPVSINAGGACPAIKALADKGYCSKENSPIESGEESMAGSGLIGSASLRGQSQILDALERFFKVKFSVDRSKTEVAQKLVQNGAKLVHELKANPDIELPYPSLGVSLFQEWKLGEYYYHSYPKDKRGELTYDEFMNEVKALQKSTEKTLADLLVQGKSEENILSFIKETMDPFFEKHHVGDKRDIMMNTRIMSRLRDVDISAYKRKVGATEKFYSDFIESSYLPNAQDEQVCAPGVKVSVDLATELKSLIDLMQRYKLDPESLLEGDKFKSNKEILQMAVAPKCLNPENRKSFQKDFLCDPMNPIILGNKLGTDQVSAVRFGVLEHLRKGLPAGNSFEYNGPFQRHINTIVGFRYNAQRGKCEYKIRESQNARSEWHDEERIARKMDQLTIVDKLK